MTRQNRFPEAVIAANATAASIMLLSSYAMAIGELIWTTDTKRLYVAASTGSRDFVRVHGLDMAVVSDGSIVTSGGQIVWQS